MNLLRSEWTKLRSVPRWLITLAIAAVLTVGVSLLAAASTNSNINEHPNFVTGPLGDPVSDAFSFAHQPVTGDVTLTVHVASLTPPPAAVDRGPSPIGKRIADTPFTGAAAGIMIKDGTRTGSSYVSVMLTANNGVRMQSDFAEDIAGSTSSGSRWLRLTRTGGTVTGEESADGSTWQMIGRLTPAALPAAAQIGFFTSSAPELFTSRGMGGSSIGAHPTRSSATFDSVTTAPPTTSVWQGDRVKMAIDEPPPGNGDDPEKRGEDIDAGPPLTENAGTYTLVGTGKVGPSAPDDDVVEASLLGVIAGLMALIAVGVLFGTSEYRRGLIRTTFTATPRRGRVLAAKAVVLGGVTFVLSLAALVTSFLAAVPILQEHGMAPPAFPTPSLTDGPVLRALLLTALFMTAVTVFALALGTLLRNSAAAITITITLIVLPVIAGTALPGTSPRWLMLTTLAGGLATQRAKPSTETLATPWSLIGPWAGIGVVCAYAVIGLGIAWWRLRRRDA
ncbi:ABC-type transport system involved in multi-copper enzyme maturation permease subunit [Allocatelliglobosispora scoriae]|uniref:ABC-type transport system involved in multi-copper enzyme maturation permease subunit n=1 Tax=Allocatelliglobosispora scoriae TaxID=643052 RepID=A0A841BZA4_9ACTN|nr:ABC transporter permease subunit [Allocatelliglobosispora scoriae]MBB5873464.1 ABC-type transport system involved in multi-copper enzyme maturation permease subunit [Allocatelliglobosispora scoriae]